MPHSRVKPCIEIKSKKISKQEWSEFTSKLSNHNDKKTMFQIIVNKLLKYD